MSEYYPIGGIAFELLSLDDLGQTLMLGAAFIAALCFLWWALDCEWPHV